MSQTSDASSSRAKALSAASKRHLRALGHPLQPVVLVGQRGITDTLMENVEAALKAHELIKIKVHDNDAFDESVAQITSRSGAALVQTIGKTMLLYRAHPTDPTITLPASGDQQGR